MRIIVGGAGSVGRSIVDYLSRGNNDIIVVDINQERLNEIAKEFDVQPVLGSISHPEIQEKIGAQKADILIAATDNDEVNMVACQVAYSLFNVPKKIARIDSEEFLSPVWNTLYNEKNLPIDLVISPDMEIAEAILRLINLPGSREVYPFANNKIKIVSFKCDEDCPLYNFKIAEIYENFKERQFTILQIVRGRQNFYPKSEESLRKGDEVYLLGLSSEIQDLMKDFGVDAKSNERIVIFGSNNIAYDIAGKLEEDDDIISYKIVSPDKTQAQDLASTFEKAEVIQGEMMSDVILKDAGLDTADMSIAVTSQDKDNLLVSLLAKHNHVSTALSLVNSRAYDNLIDNIGDNVIIDRSTITISKLLQDIRKSNLINACSLGRGFSEIWELRISAGSGLLGRKVKDLLLPERCKVLSILREDKLTLLPWEESLQEKDLILVLVSPLGIKKTEQIFGY